MIPTTFALRRATPLLALTLTGAALLAACDDDATGPGGATDVVVEASAEAFTPVDVLIGSDETITYTIENRGDGAVTMTSVALTGPDAASFRIESGDAGTALAPGGMAEIVVGFDPESEGAKEARLVLSFAAGGPPLEATVRGEAARFQYRQVDRKGIPGLNTVFNHPSGIGPFDKRGYNLASPADDVAAYRSLFLTVLGAVGRSEADAEAVADLLLPDELPVAMGAGTTSFATLTGRALSDDAVDVALTVVVGPGPLDSDGVDANDVAFRSTFPYVAPAHR